MINWRISSGIFSWHRDLNKIEVVLCAAGQSIDLFHDAHSECMQIFNNICSLGEIVNSSVLFSWLICLTASLGGEFSLVFHKYGFADNFLAKFLSENCKFHTELFKLSGNTWIGIPWKPSQTSPKPRYVCCISAVFPSDVLNLVVGIHFFCVLCFCRFSQCVHSLLTFMEASEVRTHWVNFHRTFDESVLKE